MVCKPGISITTRNSVCRQEKADPIFPKTTSNACATVALLNIIMNAHDVELGDKLQEFKAKTADLEPPLRGWLLCNNKWIRMIHNSFARYASNLTHTHTPSSSIADL